jgi:hypothetical protein
MSKPEIISQQVHIAMRVAYLMLQNDNASYTEVTTLAKTLQNRVAIQAEAIRHENVIIRLAKAFIKEQSHELS